jgi:hypothetical protein
MCVSPRYFCAGQQDLLRIYAKSQTRSLNEIHPGVGEQPHADSSSHVQTRAATCRLEQPHADSSSHMQTRAATCGLEQPHADSSSHMRTRAATCRLSWFTRVGRCACRWRARCHLFGFTRSEHPRVVWQRQHHPPHARCAHERCLLTRGEAPEGSGA